MTSLPMAKRILRHEQTLALVQKGDMLAVSTEMFIPGVQAYEQR